MNDFNVDLLTILGVLAALSALLFLMSALDPTNQRRPGTTQQPRPDTAAAPVPLADMAAAVGEPLVRHS